MITTKSLANKKILDLVDNKKIDKIFLDVDYTVYDFSLGDNRATKNLNEQHPQLGDEVSRIFKIILKAKRSLASLTIKEKKEYHLFLNEIKRIQKTDNCKFWSRETMIIMAANKIKIEINKEDIVRLRNIYWQSFLDKWQIYADAKIFLDKVKKEKIEIVWVTGSDSVLKVKNNKDEIELIYDSKYSAAFKKRRLTKLLEEYPGKLITGDPLEKPELWKIIFEKDKRGNYLVIGDSYESDLKIAVEMGITSVLIKRN